MRKKIIIMLTLLLALSMTAFMTSCGGKQEEPEEEEVMTQEVEQGPAVVKTIEGIDEDIGDKKPMQISSIILYEDGSVEIVPVDDLKKNEIKDEETTGIFPFEESGEVKDIVIVDYGDEGGRTIVALMEDGSLSAVNGSALIDEHIIAVMDNVAGRDNFVKVENQERDGETMIVGITEDGDEVVLDYSMNL